ncbi:hypothetical protein EDB87DRAFT_1692273 [Lactarius vividus]|nr:hypothetical protein EDB87DRAFT_1692273 [Lactarius vividus]
MTSICYLLDLPDEVILSIAVKLALADLASCLLSCRRLSALISESSLMQYLIRTMLHGLHDPLVSDISIPERVKALDAWERAWLDLSVSNEPFQRHSLSAVGLDAKKCIVQSGVLVGTHFNNIRLAGGYCYLDVLRLLNGSKSVARFNIPNLGGDIYVQSYTYAPENDLMVIIYQYVSLPFPSHWTLTGKEESPGHNSINSLPPIGTQAPQNPPWNLTNFGMFEARAWNVVVTT